MSETTNPIYGRFHEDGSVAAEPSFSIFSGERLYSTEGTIRERISGTPYFYRLTASEVRRVTDEDRALWRENAPKPRRTVPPRIDVPKPSHQEDSE